MIYFAKLISVIFHPALLMLLLPFLMVYRKTENIPYALKWQMFSSVFIFLAGLLVLLGERLKIFSDADLSRRNERYNFYIIVAILLLLYTSVVIFLKGIFYPGVIIAFGILFGVVIFTIANHFFKISIHSGVACAFVISVGIFYGINAFFAVVWIVPLIIWARIIQKKHTFVDAISGGVVGGIITVITYMIGGNFL